MRITRKMQRHVEAKIRHAMATGPLPMIERTSTTESNPKNEANKSDAGDSGQSK